MKVVHVIRTLAQEYGGPARSVQGLVAALEAAAAESGSGTRSMRRRNWSSISPRRLKPCAGIAKNRRVCS